jgi:fimbrial isopeptide formation D2 family protein
MRERKKRWGFVVLMSTVLVLVGLLSLTSTAWATSAQRHSEQQSVPPVKTADKTTVTGGEELVFEITFTAGPGTWYNVVVTDDIDPYLRIDAVTTSQGTPSWAGQLVTVDVGNVTAGTTVTINIQCTVRDTVPGGYEIVNTAVLVVEDPELVYRPSRTVEVEEEFVPEAGSLLLLGSGLMGLAGYAGMRWSRLRDTDS